MDDDEPGTQGGQKLVTDTAPLTTNPTTPAQPHNETTASTYRSRRVSATDEWHEFISDIRSYGKRVFLEVFAGMAVLSAAFRAEGWPVGPPVDLAYGEQYDVMNHFFLAVLIAILLEGRVLLLHVGPPCASFSMAVNRFHSHRMRTLEQPGGLDDLDAKQRKKVDDGNALAEITTKFTAAQEAAKGFWQWEQPDSSLMWAYRPVRSAVLHASFATRDVCMDGAPWKKPTRLAANSACIEGLHLRCCGGHDHQPLEGCAPCGRNWTAIASPYWPTFAQKMACAWQHLLTDDHLEVTSASSYRSALLTERADLTVTAAMANAQFQPSGKRSRMSIGAQIGAGKQPRGRALPQLVPDFLGPDAHLSVAQAVAHPFTRPPVLFPPVQYALAVQPRSMDTLNKQREEMMLALDQLAAATLEDAQFLASKVPWPTLQVMEAGGPLKNIPFMREITFIIGTVDPQLMPDFVLGLPMMGWAQHAPTQAQRDRQPEESILEFVEQSEQHNKKLLRRTKPSADATLDVEAWEKSMEEVKLGLLSQPVDNLEKLGMANPCLVRRHGLWEQHGNAKAPSVRVLDDFLEGGQNATVGYQFTHRPATLDNVAASMRAMSEEFPEPMEFFTSDFAKAFKQVPGVTELLHLAVVVQWDPTHSQPAFMIPYTQVFGGRSTPLNFARFPAWCCYAMAVLAALPSEHCVDDIIGSERRSTIHSGWALWRCFARHCGWRVPDSKSPPPVSAWASTRCRV